MRCVRGVRHRPLRTRACIGPGLAAAAPCPLNLAARKERDAGSCRDGAKNIIRVPRPSAPTWVEILPAGEDTCGASGCLCPLFM